MICQTTERVVFSSVLALSVMAFVSPSAAAAKKHAGNAESAASDKQPEGEEAALVKSKGFTMGGGLGIAVPFGRVAFDATPLRDTAPGLGVLSLEAGYRTGHWWFGGGLLGGVGSMATEGDLAPCEDLDVSCGVGLFRAEAKARFYALPGHRIDPYLGIGTGYEWFTLEIEYEEEHLLKGRVSGPSMLSLEAGAQFAKGTHLYTLFAAYSVGEFNDRSLVIMKEVETDGAISGDNRALHHWFSINAGVTFPE